MAQQDPALPLASQNRELVLFYIKHKLSQKNFPLNHLTLAATPPNRTEVGGAAQGHDPAPDPARVPAPVPHANGTLNGTTTTTATTTAIATPPPSLPLPLPATPPPPAPPATPPPPASPLRRRPSLGTTPPPPPPAVAMEAVKEALRDTAGEFELRFTRAFSDLSSQLHITPATAYQSFESVMDEVFRDGVNWGRVVGLFAFGGALCVECVEKEMSALVGRIAEWMTVYLDVHIQPWIQSQGGWERFSEVFGKDAAAESRRSQESFRKWLLAGMTLFTGVVVGSLFAQKRL